MIVLRRVSIFNTLSMFQLRTAIWGLPSTLLTWGLLCCYDFRLAVFLDDQLQHWRCLVDAAFHRKRLPSLRGHFEGTRGGKSFRDFFEDTNGRKHTMVLMTYLGFRIYSSALMISLMSV